MPCLKCFADISERPIYHALVSAYMSIILGITEAILAIYTGHADISMALYGIALMAIVDVTGSVLVVFMYYGMSNEVVHNPDKKTKELRYSQAIGVLMILLGLFLVADSASDLEQKDSPQDAGTIGSALQVITSVYGALGSLSMAAYKYKVGKALHSSVVLADSISSFCAGLASVASLVVAIDNNSIWWLDGVTGMMVACYTLYSGVVTIWSASRELSDLQSCEVDHEQDPLMSTGKHKNRSASSSSIPTARNYQTDYTENDMVLKRNAAASMSSGSAMETPHFYNSDYEDTHRDSINVLEGAIAQSPLQAVLGSDSGDFTCVDSAIPTIAVNTNSSNGHSNDTTTSHSGNTRLLDFESSGDEHVAFASRL